MMQKEFGKCSICGKETWLSVDHIPPKCCGNNSDTYYITYVLKKSEKFSGNEIKPVHSQNGLKFVNICHACNNNMGSKYDTHLQKFRNVILSLIQKTQCNDKFVLENVCKSVIGHFLAASSYDSCTYSQIMRNYYLNDDKTIYDEYSLRCAYYPHKNNIFSFNNYVLADLSSGTLPYGMISSLYFYPFAFIFCEKQYNIIGSDLFEICKNNLMLTINTDDWNDKAPYWPAISDKGHAIMTGATINDSKYKIK